MIAVAAIGKVFQRIAQFSQMLNFLIKFGHMGKSNFFDIVARPLVFPKSKQFSDLLH